MAQSLVALLHGNLALHQIRPLLLSLEPEAWASCYLKGLFNFELFAPEPSLIRAMRNADLQERHRG
jgi:hypothetical protein